MRINRAPSGKLVHQLLIGIAFILSSSLCFAGIYKWVDDQGNVHYGQQRPSDAPATKMEVQRYAPEDVSSYKKPGAKDPDSEDDAEKKEDAETKEAEKPPETAAQKKARLAACAEARKNLATIQSSGRIRSKDKDGNITYLSQEQKEARLKSTRDLIAKRCK